ncbi:MAG: TetR/AcrR family transcriptional regulator [Pontiellaceae bacterium]|nr:TetR/AcrR family transcriptional regulator [Pontiellaceae bacterium]
MNEKPMKDAIADAFKKHFTYFGFRKTSVNDVSKELQISKKTIYAHFSSKERIFYYIISRVAYEIQADMKTKLVDLPSWTEKVSELVRMIFEESRKWLKTQDAFEFKYKYEIAQLAFKEAFGKLLHEYITVGMANGEFAAGNVEMKVGFVQGLISEAMRLLTSDPSIEVEEELIASIRKILV